MNPETSINVKGSVRVTVRDLAGNILHQEEEGNLVVTAGLSALAHLLAGAGTGLSVDRIGFGTGTADPAAGDTGISENAVLKTVSGVQYPSAGSVTFSAMLSGAEGNGLSITELGLLSSGGTLIARRTRAAIVKDSSIFVDAAWTLTIGV